MSTKDQVLQALSRGQVLSGEQLAQDLGFSRNAVWKAINQLRREGCVIEAATNRGYRLLSSPSGISRAGIGRWLATETFAREMEVHNQLDSTNNRAKELAAAGAPHGFLVTAETQTGGRGRMGRSFFSPGESGVYLSFVLRPSVSPQRAAMITSLTAVAVAEAIGKMTAAEVKIKWVNDLYMGGKKICGILSEAGMSMESGALDYVVTGIGVNVLPMAFPPELADVATSIGNETGERLDRNRLIAEIAGALEKRYGELESGAFLAESRRRSNVIGREVLVLEGGRSYRAKALEIDDEGKLVVETAEGITHLGYGEVSLKLS